MHRSLINRLRQTGGWRWADACIILHQASRSRLGSRSSSSRRDQRASPQTRCAAEPRSGRWARYLLWTRSRASRLRALGAVVETGDQGCTKRKMMVEETLKTLWWTRAGLAGPGKQPRWLGKKSRRSWRSGATGAGAPWWCSWPAAVAAARRHCGWSDSARRKDKSPRCGRYGTARFCTWGACSGRAARLCRAQTGTWHRTCTLHSPRRCDRARFCSAQIQQAPVLLLGRTGRRSGPAGRYTGPVEAVGWTRHSRVLRSYSQSGQPGTGCAVGQSAEAVPGSMAGW